MLELHGHPFSSYTWKALIPLYVNDTPFEFREMAGDRPLSEQFPGKVHPGGHIPVLVDGDSVVVEATSIVEHLESWACATRPTKRRSPPARPDFGGPIAGSRAGSAPMRCRRTSRW